MNPFIYPVRSFNFDTKYCKKYPAETSSILNYINTTTSEEAEAVVNISTFKISEETSVPRDLVLKIMGLGGHRSVPVMKQYIPVYYQCDNGHIVYFLEDYKKACPECNSSYRPKYNLICANGHKAIGNRIGEYCKECGLSLVPNQEPSLF